MEEDYEIVPLNPIRRLEKRLERVEKTDYSSDTIKDLVNIVKSNQRIVDEIVKMNSTMLNRVTELLESVNSLTEKMNNFMERIEVVSEAPKEPEEEKVKEIDSKVDERLVKLEKRVNSLLLSSIAKTKLQGMKRPQ